MFRNMKVYTYMHVTTINEKGEQGRVCGRVWRGKERAYYYIYIEHPK